MMGSMTSHGVDSRQGRGQGRGRGQGQGQGQNIRQNPTWTPSGPKTDPDGIIYKFCHQLRPEQKLIVQELQDGKDIYVNMGAGGGKTLPIICYWLNSILGLNVLLKRDLSNRELQEGFNNLTKILLDSEDLPKIMFLVPIKSLGIQMQDEFRKAIVILLSQFFTKIIDPDIISFNNYSLMSYMLNRLETYGIRSINNVVYQIKALLRQVGQFDVNNNPDDYKIDELNTRRLQLFDELKNEILIYIKKRTDDLVVKKDGEGTVGNMKTAIVAVTIYQSSVGVIKQLKNVKLIVCDEAHMTQSPSLDQINDTQSKNIAYALYDLLNGIRGKNIQLAFLTGTIHPNSALQFTKYLKKCFKRNFNAPLTLPGKNPATIKVVVDDSLQFQSNWVKILRRHIEKQDYGNLFILYSGPGIERLSEELLNSVGFYPSGSQDNPFAAHKQKKKTTFFSLDDLKTPVNLNDAGRIKHPLLRQCVQHGFAFIHGSKHTKFGPVEGNDKTIVQDLFLHRKISIVIATDAIGVGMNMSAKNMYIAQNEKYADGRGTIQVPLRDLVQLINRVGRMAFKLGFIYTPQKYADEINEAILANPESFHDIGAIKHLACKRKFFSHMFLNMTQYHQFYKDYKKQR